MRQDRKILKDHSILSVKCSKEIFGMFNYIQITETLAVELFVLPFMLLQHSFNNYLPWKCNFFTFVKGNYFKIPNELTDYYLYRNRLSNSMHAKQNPICLSKSFNLCVCICKLCSKCSFS